MTYKTFETERLILRPTTPEDARLVYEIFNTPKFKEFIGERNVSNEEDALKYLEEKTFPQIERLGYGNYTVILKDNGAKIGNCGLYDREGLKGVDIGFSYLPEYYGKGYGYEAAVVLRDAAFQEFGLEEIGAITTKENIVSQKLIEKLGLKFIRIINIPNDPEDLLYYRITKAEWQR